MKTIKFRAWTGKRMDYFDFERRNVHRNLNKGYDIMQFTGLQDKNGKDIYEGDIVKVNFERNKIAKEHYKKDKFIVDIGHRRWIKGEEMGWEGELLIAHYNSEVIGNIHENPELLK